MDIAAIEPVSRKAGREALADILENAAKQHGAMCLDRQERRVDDNRWLDLLLWHPKQVLAQIAINAKHRPGEWWLVHWWVDTLSHRRLASLPHLWSVNQFHLQKATSAVMDQYGLVRVVGEGFAAVDSGRAFVERP